MADMSVIWLRVAAALYSIGLLHAILTLVRRREHLFRVALGAFILGGVFHFVSIIEEGVVNHRCPIATVYETLSMCAFLVVVLYLAVYAWNARLAFEPSVTRLIMIGVILIVLMNARPQGLVGPTRVEATA